MTRRHALMPITVTLLSGLGFLALAQEGTGSNISQLCDQLRCYAPRTIHINMEDGAVASFDLDTPFPIVQGGEVIAIFPGDVIYLEAEVSDDRLVNIRAVEEPSGDTDFLEIKMWQEPGKSDTYLSLINHFSELIKYRAGMMLPAQDGIFATSSCPVLDDGRVAFEHWGYPIFQLMLADFQFIYPEGDSLVCE